MESWQEVPQPHDKLTQVYGKPCRCTECQLMLTEGSAAAKILLRKITRVHEKLTEVDGRYCGRTES